VNLFDLPAAARSTDALSSHEAAAKVSANGVAASNRDAALAAVRAHPGSTARELAALIGMDRVEMGRRLPELATLGLIRRGPMRECTVNTHKMLTWWPAKQEETNGTE
jgi:hypothetical protein